MKNSISYSELEIPDYLKDKKKWKKYAKNNFFTFELYETVNQEYFSKFKELSKKSKNKKEVEYFNFIIEFFFKIDTNIVELNRGLKLLTQKNNLMPSIFLLRGFTELIFFNIFIAFKSYLFIKKNNVKGLADLICKASLGSGIRTIKSDIIKSESVILKNIIEKYHEKRIHINDCIRFFKKNPFEKIIKTKENKKIKSFYILEELKKPLDFKFINKQGLKKHKKRMTNIINEDTRFIIDAYDRMCEIIHPTGILIYDAQDKRTQYDYRELYHYLGGSNFFYINLFALFYKMFVLYWFDENKETFIDEFNSNLNEK